MIEARSSDIVWNPDEQIMANANLTAFMARQGVSDFDALNRRAETDPAWFWNSVIEHFDLRFDTPYESVMDDSKGKPWTRWCVGGTTNVVLNALDRHRDTSLWERTVIDWEGENGTRRAWTYAELDRETCRPGLRRGSPARDCGLPLWGFRRHQEPQAEPRSTGRTAPALPGVGLPAHHLCFCAYGQQYAGHPGGLTRRRSRPPLSPCYVTLSFC